MRNLLENSTEETSVHRLLLYYFYVFLASIYETDRFCWDRLLSNEMTSMRMGECSEIICVKINFAAFIAFVVKMAMEFVSLVFCMAKTVFTQRVLVCFETGTGNDSQWVYNACWWRMCLSKYEHI